MISLHTAAASAKTKAEVMSMAEYTDLYDVLADDKEARRLFRSLPDYVQGAVQQHACNIHSEKEFRDFVSRQYSDQ